MMKIFSSRTLWGLGLSLCAGLTVLAQDRVEEQGYLTTPVEVPGGILVSDNYGSSICLGTRSGIQEIVSGRGTGYYWAVSPDRRFIGYKRILDDGMQIPEVCDLASGEIRRLHDPVPLAGQVSFAADGSPAFTIGAKLHVLRNGAEEVFEIGTSVNIAPVSPDGSRIAYAAADGSVHILDLRSGVDREIRSAGAGSAFPAWAPDGAHLLYSTLDGTASVFDLRDGRTKELAQACSPAWSPDGSRITFYRKEISGGRLVNSDLFIAFPDGTGLVRITETPDVCEMEPSFASDGGSILCQTYDRRSVRSVRIATGETEERLRPSTIRLQYYVEPEPLRKTTVLDIPYVNQVYDTPDWFNGHSACGPTTSSMLLAHYRALPPWPGWCSTPTGHVNVWGRYVADRYRFKETDYIWQANDPNRRLAQGGFGYMWSTGSPHSMMASYYNRHGITASTLDSPSLQTAADEVTAGRPYSLCVDLTSAGHIVLAHTYEGNGTFVTNDPYGDKNKPGYPNYHGKDARYDWPGWNNGHINFGRYVYWAVSGSYSRPAVTDTLVDDLQVETGFFLYNQAPVSMLSWKDANRGFNDHFWYTYTHASPATDSCYATWTPNLPRAGAYEVYAYIPYSNATAARYKVQALSGQQVVEVNQKTYRDAWVSLGTFDFAAGDAGMVRLGDASSADRQELVFDAVRWSYRGAATGAPGAGTNLPSGIALEQNYPNPFNGQTGIQFRIGEPAEVRLAVYDMLGRETALLLDGRKPSGVHSVSFDAGSLPGGAYVVRLTAGGTVLARKMILLR